MRKKYIGIILSLIIAIVLFAGCQGQSDADETETVAEDPGVESVYVGQITAIDGDQITLSLGTLSEMEMPEMTDEDSSGDSSGDEDREQMEPPSDEDSSGEDSSLEDEASDSETSDGETSDGEMPDGEMPDGEAPDSEAFDGEHKGGGSFTASGEEMTITVTDDTVITLAGLDEDETGALEDLEVDDIVTVTLSDDVVTEITVESVGGGMDGEFEQPVDGMDSESTDVSDESESDS